MLLTESFAEDSESVFLKKEIIVLNTTVQIFFADVKAFLSLL